MNARKLLALTSAAIAMGLLSSGAAHAQWLTSGNIAGPGDVLGTLNFADLNIVTNGTNRLNITSTGQIKLNGILFANFGATINGTLSANLGANFNGPVSFNGPTIMNNGPLLVNNAFYSTGSTGLGINYAVNTVDANGNMVIGSSYAGSLVAPTNSLLVEQEVGVGYTSNPGLYALYVNGDTWTSGIYSNSDARWKENVATIGGALDKVMKFRGVSYDFRRKDYPGIRFPEGHQVGFIAQEMEKVMPEVVVTNTDGYKGISYQNLTAVLAEAIKEQQQMIRKQNARIAALEAALGISSTEESETGSSLDIR